VYCTPSDLLSIRLAPTLSAYPQLWCYDGVEISVHPNVRPNAVYLREHAVLARAGWKDLPLSETDL
jgi:hypothetical protein